MEDAKDQRDNGSGPCKALLIGIQYKDQQYRGEPLDLKGPHEDVKAMRDYLINTWNYPNDNISELLDEPGRMQPTRTNILKYLDLLVQAPAPKTRLFLYYSGHGHQVPERTDSTTTEPNGKDQTLVPLDWQNGLIRDNTLYDHVVNRLPPGCRFTAVFDCCHSGTLLDLPYTRESAHQMHPDEMPVSPITTMYYTAILPTSPPGLMPPSPRVAELSGTKTPQRAMTYPAHAQELSNSGVRQFKEYEKLPRENAVGPKVHWFKKWFEVLRKPAVTVDINTECSIAVLVPLTSQLAATHPDEVGYPLRRESTGHEDVVFISPIRESSNQNGYQLPWDLTIRASEGMSSKALDGPPKRYSDSHASTNAPTIRDPLLLPTVFSIGACADSGQVIEGRGTNAGLLRSALTRCLAEAKGQTWEGLLDDLRKFINESPEFVSHNQTKAWPVIGSMKNELTDIVEF